MNNYRIFPLLLVTFIVLAIAAVIQSTIGNQAASQRLTPTPEVTDAAPQTGSLLRVFPELAVLDIQAVRIENPTDDQSLTIVRDSSGNWTSPDLEGTLDTNLATDVARTIVLLPYGRSINILNDTDLGDFELAPTPQYLISIVLSDGTGHILAVGKLSESDPIYYVLVDERDEILEVERGPIEFLTNFLNSPPVNLTN
jgi:hypothetical protein